MDGRGYLAHLFRAFAPAATGGEPRPWSSAAIIVMYAGLYSFPLLLVMRPVVSQDVWWHLRIGEWIAEHGRVPWDDPFSRYASGPPFIAYSWLYDLVVHAAHALGGHLGLVVLTMCACLASTLIVHRVIRAHQPPLLVEVLLLGAWTAMIVPFLTPRAWFFSIVFFVIEIHVITRALDAPGTRSTRQLWLLPVIFALWANVHLMFLYGIVVLLLACLAVALGPFTAPRHAENGRVLRPLLLVTAASMVATIVNPYHVHLYEAIASFARASGQYEYVSELQGPRFRTASSWVLLALTLTAAFVLGRASRLRWFPILLFVFAVVMSYTAMHDAWLVAAVAITIIAAARWPGAVFVCPALPPKARGAVATLVLVAVLATAAGRGISEAKLESGLGRAFPVAAAGFVRHQGYPGPLYNDFDWGGYLMWALPELRVSIDGRTYFHGDRRIGRSAMVWEGVGEWASDPELRTSRLVIANRASRLCLLLRTDARFERVYEDEIAAVFVRRPET